MKKFLFLALLMGMVSVVSFAQTPTIPAKTVNVDPTMEEKSGAVMTLEADVIDYGTIEQHGEPLRKLKFTNTGTEPLIIKNARGSCGCTVPTWTKEPVMPGESSVLEVRYATNRLGKINKKVTITTNEGGKPHVVRVVGEVLAPKKEESVPAGAPSIIKGK